MILQALPLLEQPILQNKYAQAGFILLLTIIIATVATFLLKGIIHTLTRKTKTTLDDILVDKLKGPAWWLILSIGLNIAILPLDIPTNYDTQITKSFLIFILTIIVARVLDVLIQFFGKRIASKTETSIDNELLPLAHKSIYVLIYIIGVLVILSSWGIEIGPMLASLGIAGIAIGFALKDSLSNIFGGISLLMDHTFRKGDLIRLDDGTTGVVYDIGLRSTRIKTADNQLVTIPNGNLSIAKIENWKQPDLSVRVTVTFGVEYGTKLEKVQEMIINILKKDKDVMNDPKPRVLFSEMGESALMFKALFFIDTIDKKIDAEERIKIQIYNALNKAKIAIPYATRTVYLKKAK